jgi:molybdopterin converting factor small subunit
VTVEVRLFATLAAYLPPGSKDGVARLDMRDGACVADVVARLGIPAGLDRVFLVNGVEAASDRRLGPGDSIDMFPPLAGG